MAYDDALVEKEDEIEEGNARSPRTWCPVWPHHRAESVWLGRVQVIWGAAEVGMRSSLLSGVFQEKFQADSARRQ